MLDSSSSNGAVSARPPIFAQEMVRRSSATWRVVVRDHLLEVSQNRLGISNVYHHNLQDQPAVYRQQALPWKYCLRSSTHQVKCARVYYRVNDLNVTKDCCRCSRLYGCCDTRDKRVLGKEISSHIPIHDS